MKKGGNKNQEKSGNNNVGFGFAWTPLETFNGWIFVNVRKTCQNDVRYEISFLGIMKSHNMLKKYYLKIITEQILLKTSL